jgi:putative ABC transport system substrate-binding protein
MTRPTVIIVTAFALLVFTISARAEAAAKVPRIGFLSLTTAPMPQLGALRQGLRELGYVEGKNLVIIYRSAERRPKRLPALAAELVALKVDLIVTYSTPGVRAARGATSTIPIVIGAVGAADRRGFVDSLARPGGNVTGLSFIGEALNRKRTSLLREALPGMSRLAILHHAAHPKGAVRNAEKTARSIGLEVQLHPVTDRKSLQRAFAAMKAQRADAFSVLPSPIILANRKAIVALAARHRLAGIYGFREFVVDGGLMSYAPSLAHLFRRAATYVDRILKGANPAEMPVEQPTEFEFVINLGTAKALGIAIPPAILLRATELIE